MSALEFKLKVNKMPRSIKHFQDCIIAAYKAGKMQDLLRRRLEQEMNEKITKDSTIDFDSNDC